MTELSPHQRIIERCGGVRSLSALLGLPVTTVQSWFDRGYIPARRHQSVIEAALAAGIGVRPTDFFDAEAIRSIREARRGGAVRASA